MNTPGNRAKKRREELGLTQTEVSRMIGIKQPTLANFESGKNTRTKFLPELARALEMHIDELADTQPHKAASNNSNQNVPRLPNDGITISAEEVTKLIALYAQSTAIGRRNIMNSAFSAEKISGIAILGRAKNQPK